MTGIDPTAMTEQERFAELAELLARGVQRFFAAECKPKAPPRNPREQLDVLPAVEAPCGSRVLSPQSRTA